LAAVAFTAVSASLIFFNYVLQTAFVPLWLDKNESLVSMVTMANPVSLGWALEMYGYGILGVATGFAASLFGGSGRQRAIRLLLYANCLFSILGAVLFPALPGWVLSLPGMLLGGAWNVLIAATMILVILEFRFGKAGDAVRRGGRQSEIEER
jgi:hypothetical protein